MTLTDNIGQEEFKPPCTGMGCNNIGIFKLQIILVNKWAYFCAKHKKELEECGLVSRKTNLKSLEVPS